MLGEKKRLKKLSGKGENWEKRGFWEVGRDCEVEDIGGLVFVRWIDSFLFEIVSKIEGWLERRNIFEGRVYVGIFLVGF